MSDEEKVIRDIPRALQRKLAGFTADFPSDLDPWTMSAHRPDAKDFPVPELVLFLLRNIMGWKWQGVGEKVRWSVYGSVVGEPVGFELRKFGFTILRIDGYRVPTSRIIGQLKRALKEVEALLEPYAHEQIENGEVLIINRSSEFISRYKFFRSLANRAYGRAKKGPRRRFSIGRVNNFNQQDLNEAGFMISDYLNYTHRAQSEGFYYSVAVIDAYFSALEHRIVLLRAFTGAPLSPGELTSLLASKWDDKLNAVIPVSGVRTTELLLSSMRRIKDRIRNPFAHGGVENDRGSLFFRLPNVGLLPANLLRFGDSVRFSFLPIAAADHAECCSAFDQLDDLLATGALSGAHRLLEAGVDPVFDEQSVERYAEAIAGGEEGVERFIDRWGAEWMQHANMDY